MHTTTHRRLAVTAASLALATVLAACGDAAPGRNDGSGTTATSAAPASADDADHNQADVRFAQMMIIHHQGAVAMAELVLARASTAEVRALARRIAEAQGPEIELMSTWLESWGAARPEDAAMEGMDHGGMDMDGMGQEQAMEALREVSGSDVERSFLGLMTDHHRGAIEMAQDELAQGADKDARELARKIVADQTAEIAEMQGMLATR